MCVCVWGVVGGGAVGSNRYKKNTQQPIHSKITFPAIQGAAKPKSVQGSEFFFGGCGKEGEVFAWEKRVDQTFPHNKRGTKMKKPTKSINPVDFDLSLGSL